MRHRLCALLILLTCQSGIAVAQSPDATSGDRLATPGCMARAEANELIHKQGAIALRLSGSSFDDTGQMLELDQGKAFFNFFLVLYTRDGEFRFSILKHDRPFQLDPTDVCVLIAGPARGVLGDARPGNPGVANSLQFNAGAGLAQCRTLRPAILASVDRRLVADGGSVSTVGEQRTRMRAMLWQLSCEGDSAGCYASELKRRLAEAADVDAKGDAHCSTLAAQIERMQGQGCRLVAQLVGRELREPAEDAGFSFLLCSRGGEESWEVLKTFQSGATIRWAGGKPFLVNAEYYGKAADRGAAEGQPAPTPPAEAPAR